MKTEDVIAERVNVAMDNRFRIELADRKTQIAISGEERRNFLTIAFNEIAAGMGLDRFAETPVERLDQFAVMSTLKNHDTQGLLRSLVNSFMIAYTDPETADQAFKALVQIEALRAKLADNRGEKAPNAELQTAVDLLKTELADRYLGHSISNPQFRILVGPDRLFVMAPKPMDDLPSVINGFPVEFMADDLIATCH